MRHVAIIRQPGECGSLDGLELATTSAGNLFRSRSGSIMIAHCLLLTGTF